MVKYSMINNYQTKRPFRCFLKYLSNDCHRLTIIKNLLHLIKWLTFSKVGVFIICFKYSWQSRKKQSIIKFIMHIFFFINFSLNGHLLRILKLLQLPGMKKYINWYSSFFKLHILQTCILYLSVADERLLKNFTL